MVPLAVAVAIAIAVAISVAIADSIAVAVANSVAIAVVIDVAIAVAIAHRCRRCHQPLPLRLLLTIAGAITGANPTAHDCAI
jgi:hypothetical protein